MSLRQLAPAMLALLWLCAWRPASAAGFQRGVAADPDDKPLPLAIWYPSNATPRAERFGPLGQTVAIDGALSGGGLPLIVLSHGSGGSAFDSYDTAVALAEAGFVVAAVTHTGDNFKDHTRAFVRRNFVDRPRHVSRVIDFMLSAWPGHEAIDPSRIGIFGHSAGGAAALIVIGGSADWTRAVAFCRSHPEDWGCRNARQNGASSDPVETAMIVGSDARIKAAVVAAPALSAAFLPKGLATVAVPVQLWVASNDRIVPDGDLVRRNLPIAPDYHRVEGAGHFAFLAPCPEPLAATGAEFCTDPKGFDRAAFLGLFQRAVIAFYSEHLKPE